MERTTEKKTKVVQRMYAGERALFSARDMIIEDSVFRDGESPLEESADIGLINTVRGRED